MKKQTQKKPTNNTTGYHVVRSPQNNTVETKGCAVCWASKCHCNFKVLKPNGNGLKWRWGFYSNFSTYSVFFLWGRLWLITTSFIGVPSPYLWAVVSPWETIFIKWLHGVFSHCVCVLFSCKFYYLSSQSTANNCCNIDTITCAAPSGTDVYNSAHIDQQKSNNLIILFFLWHKDGFLFA